MTAIDLLCPVKPHELDRKDLRQWEDLVQRVTARAVAHGLGRDLLLLVYMAGFYHGIKLMEEKPE